MCKTKYSIKSSLIIIEKEIVNKRSLWSPCILFICRKFQTFNVIHVERILAILVTLCWIAKNIAY